MPGKHGTPEERFWPKVQKTEDGCWLWLGSKPHGYGRFYDGTTKVQAHRFSYELVVGPIPPGLHLDHLCRTPACVRPDHLEPVTARINLLRGNTLTAREHAQTHCRRGHEFTEDNTYRSTKPSGSVMRHCKECRRINQRLWKGDTSTERRYKPRKDRGEKRGKVYVVVG